jgi:hypothetical protein
MLLELKAIVLHSAPSLLPAAAEAETTVQLDPVVTVVLAAAEHLIYPGMHLNPGVLETRRL